MNTIMLLKNIEMRIVVVLYARSEERAIRTWSELFRDEWEVIYLNERKPTGHRYQLTCKKDDEQGNLYSREIICFSKKEALFLKNKIERINQNYIIQIKKLY